MSDRISHVCVALADRLEVHVSDLHPLPDTGLAHDHVRIAGAGTLARVPKQSQLGLAPADNLEYQAACFERAAVSAHAPRLHDTLAPDDRLPMGALIVELIDGRPLSLPGDLAAMAECLAAIHALALPEERAPLKDPVDPLADTFTEVMAQAAYIAAADLHPEAEAQIREELRAAGATLGRDDRPPRTLIAFDAHPGNYLMAPDGRAILVDLEKARYGAAGFDLAHASLYTSTTWDVDSHAVLDRDQVEAFHAAWLDAVPGSLASATEPWLWPLRRIMWLWSVTWCAKWRVESRRDVGDEGATENWSAALSEDALVAHVAGRVTDYLDPETISRVRADWQAPAEEAGPAVARAG
ncbi:MAG: aminoglycoside phosphotransferase family protein [Alphaproteobacteria bacterium]